jgi:hypothetical protein
VPMLVVVMMVVIVIVVVRRVLLAGMTTLGLSHVCLLSRWCARNGHCRGGSNIRRRCRRLGLLGRYEVFALCEPGTRDLGVGTDASGAASSA